MAIFWPFNGPTFTSRRVVRIDSGSTTHTCFRSASSGSSSALNTASIGTSVTAANSSENNLERSAITVALIPGSTLRSSGAGRENVTLNVSVAGSALVSCSL